MTPRPRFQLPLPGRGPLVLGPRTLIMGVLNVTPDSFADGGRYGDAAHAVDAALAMVADGADLIDVGGESTRPGASPLSAADERARIEPVLRRLSAALSVPISIDTYKADVAAAALDLGATIVNDVSALGYDAALSSVVAARRAALVLMHTRGRSRDMYEEAHYDDVAADVARELDARVTAAVEAGIPREALILDPGLGFAKRAEHSGRLLADLGPVARLGRPLLVGPSRKSFLTRAVGDRLPAEREWATAAAVTAAVLGGAHIVRVHGVQAMADVVKVADMLRRDAGLDRDESGETRWE